MDWASVGDWLKANAGPGAALVGSLLTGNVPGAVAAGVALVSSATGHATPDDALAAFQSDPATVVRLRELAQQDAQSIRQHLEAMTRLELEDRQAEHKETQDTIRNGDTATDEYVRRTRPMMARQSWYVTAGYVVAFEGLKAAGVFKVGAVMELAMLLLGPAGAYLGLRTWDKIKAPAKG